ncbi:MAG: STAS domain-containing protein [Rhizobiaceae bacterium]|nr:STAS domain-containing protein [Rhizobiaceae bacterium]
MLELTDSVESGATIVHASGKLDTLTAKSFENYLKGHVETGSGPLLVDMEAIEYVSSFGLRSLLIIAKLMAPYGRKFILFSPNASVLEVLRVSGFLRIISVAESRDKALADTVATAGSGE